MNGKDERQCRWILKWTLIGKWIPSRLLANAKDVVTNGHQVVMIENQPTVEDERRLLHATVDQFVIQFLEKQQHS